MSAPAVDAAEAKAAARAWVPPRANTAVPAAPPSLPAESFRKTAAVPADQGPHAVNSTPRVDSGPRTASSSNASWTRSATAIGIMRIASRPYLAPRPRNAHPTLSAGDRVGERRRADVRGRRDVHVGEEGGDRSHLAVELGERVRVPRVAAAELLGGASGVAPERHGRSVGLGREHPHRRGEQGESVFLEREILDHRPPQPTDGVGEPGSDEAGSELAAAEDAADLGRALEDRDPSSVLREETRPPRARCGRHRSR